MKIATCQHCGEEYISKKKGVTKYFYCNEQECQDAMFVIKLENQRRLRRECYQRNKEKVKHQVKEYRERHKKEPPLKTGTSTGYNCEACGEPIKVTWTDDMLYQTSNRKHCSSCRAKLLSGRYSLIFLQKKHGVYKPEVVTFSDLKTLGFGADYLNTNY